MRLILHPFYLHFISIICAVAPKYLCFHLSGSNAVNSKVEDWDVWTSKFEAQTPKYQTPLSALLRSVLLRSALLADPFRLCISSLSNYHSQQSEVRTEGAVDLGCAIRIAVLPCSLPVFKVNKLKGRLMLVALTFSCSFSCSLAYSPLLPPVPTLLLAANLRVYHYFHHVQHHSRFVCILLTLFTHNYSSPPFICHFLPRKRSLFVFKHIPEGWDPDFAIQTLRSKAHFRACSPFEICYSIWSRAERSRKLLFSFLFRFSNFTKCIWVCRFFGWRFRNGRCFGGRFDGSKSLHRRVAWTSSLEGFMMLHDASWWNLYQPHLSICFGIPFWGDSLLKGFLIFSRHLDAPRHLSANVWIGNSNLIRFIFKFKINFLFSRMNSYEFLLINKISSSEVWNKERAVAESGGRW